jgi:hypothetical protein
MLDRRTSKIDKIAALDHDASWICHPGGMNVIEHIHWSGTLAENRHPLFRIPL